MGQQMYQNMDVSANVAPGPTPAPGPTARGGAPVAPVSYRGRGIAPTMPRGRGFPIRGRGMRDMFAISAL